LTVKKRHYAREDKLVCLVSISPVVKRRRSHWLSYIFMLSLQEFLSMRSGDVITKTSVCYGTVVESKVDSFCPCNIFATLLILLCIIIAIVPRLP
jgi:hypothetical protein